MGSSISTTLDILLVISDGAALLDYAQAARALGMAEQTLRNQVNDKKKKTKIVSLKVGRARRFPAVDLAYYIDGGVARSLPAPGGPPLLPAATLPRPTPVANVKRSRGRPRKVVPQRCDEV